MKSIKDVYLTDTQLEVAVMASQGLTAKEIAIRRDRKASGIARHLNDIYRAFELDPDGSRKSQHLKGIRVELEDALAARLDRRALRLYSDRSVIENEIWKRLQADPAEVDMLGRNLATWLADWDRVEILRSLYIKRIKSRKMSLRVLLPAVNSKYLELLQGDRAQNIVGSDGRKAGESRGVLTRLQESIAGIETISHGALRTFDTVIPPGIIRIDSHMWITIYLPNDRGSKSITLFLKENSGNSDQDDAFDRFKGVFDDLWEALA
jgi:hypothetical protein